MTDTMGTIRGDEGGVLDLATARAARAATPPGNGGHALWGLLPIAAALALWAFAVAGVLAPLGGALGRLDAERQRAAAPLTCPTPPGALASAATARQADRCQ